MRRRAFTLVELLVVLAVIALLVGLLLPALAAARSTGRSAVCLSNTRSLSLALLSHATDRGGRFVRVREDLAPSVGRRWWFGLEEGPLAGGTRRPIDLSRSPLAPYTADLAGGLSCPDFPFDDPGFNPKFATPSAHYGLNGGLAAYLVQPEPRRLLEVADASGTFAFADAVHQDFSAASFNEPHEVAFRAVGFASGAGHFRHANAMANASFVDGHAEALEAPEAEAVWARFGGGAVVNLDRFQGAGTRYGFPTWTAASNPGTVLP